MDASSSFAVFNLIPRDSETLSSQTSDAPISEPLTLPQTSMQDPILHASFPPPPPPPPYSSLPFLAANFFPASVPMLLSGFLRVPSLMLACFLAVFPLLTLVASPRCLYRFGWLTSLHM